MADEGGDEIVVRADVQQLDGDVLEAGEVLELNRGEGGGDHSSKPLADAIFIFGLPAGCWRTHVKPAKHQLALKLLNSGPRERTADRRSPSQRLG